MWKFIIFLVSSLQKLKDCFTIVGYFSLICHLLHRKRGAQWGELLTPQRSDSAAETFQVLQKSYYRWRYFLCTQDRTLSAKWEDQENDGLESGSYKRQDIAIMYASRQKTEGKFSCAGTSMEVTW